MEIPPHESPLQTKVFDLYAKYGIDTENFSPTINPKVLELKIEEAFSHLTEDEVNMIAVQFSCIGYSASLLAAICLWPHKFATQDIVDAVYYINADLTPRLRRLQAVIGEAPF